MSIPMRTNEILENHSLKINEFETTFGMRSAGKTEVIIPTNTNPRTNLGNLSHKTRGLQVLLQIKVNPTTTGPITIFCSIFMRTANARTSCETKEALALTAPVESTQPPTKMRTNTFGCGTNPSCHGLIIEAKMSPNNR